MFDLKAKHSLSSWLIPLLSRCYYADWMWAAKLAAYFNLLIREEITINKLLDHHLTGVVNITTARQIPVSKTFQEVQNSSFRHVAHLVKVKCQQLEHEAEGEKTKQYYISYYHTL